jgi:Membrane protein involved in colicin uptake
MADPFDTPGYRFALNRFPGDGSTTQWDLSFAGVSPGYISQDHVQATIVNDTTGVRTPYPLGPGNFILPTRLQVTPAVPVGSTLEVRRNSPKDEPLLDYTDGALMIEKNLDTSNQQTVYATAEMVDRFADALDETAEFSQAVLDRLADVEDTANGADAKADSAITSAAAANVTAASAVSLANTAIATANQAVEDVAGAEEAAILATEAADAANLAATNANASAVAATGTAAAALDTAEDAVTIANGATGTANNALSVANGIAATAQEALDTAEAAETTANGIAATANEALDTANDAEATANSFEARVSAMEPRVNPILLPATAHSLDDYRSRGLYAQNATAGAVAGGASYPVALAGLLLVWAANGVSAANLLSQEYIVYGAEPGANNSGGRRFWRSCTNQVSGAWGPWREVARKNEVMSHVYLTAATDCNTLTADNTYYTSRSGTVITGGSNWPPIGTNVAGASVVVHWVASDYIIQTATIPVAGEKPRLCQRIFSGSSWGTWRMIGAVSAVSRLPTADMGDVYVDGAGWYRWNGSAYAASTPVTGTLDLSGATNGQVAGNFDGTHTADTWSFVNKKAATTYLPVVPPAGQNSAHAIFRSAASADSAFVALGYNGTLGHGELTFSRHGTAAVPGAFRFISATTECARILSTGSWIFGPYLYTPSINARTHVYYTGGGTQYGTVYRPELFADGVAIQFQAYNGAVAGFIQSNSALSVVYSTTSDYRSKTVLGELDGAGCLDNIMRLRPVEFRMHGVPVVNKPLRGFVAHELQDVIPQAVTGYKDQTRVDEVGNTVPVMQGVDLSKVLPDVVAALQEQQRQIQSLKEELAQIRATLQGE